MKFNQILYFFIISSFYIFPQSSLLAQCTCTNCPQVMPDFFQGTFPISIMGATSPTLGVGGQGVCGISLNINHEYIGDLSITLTAPNGSTIELIGPIGLFGATDGSVWNINFVRSTDPTDPDGSFSAVFDTDQPWGLNGNYTGTYLPQSGNLEDLTGPVNGIWTISVTDNQSMDIGNFLDYTITFCNPNGITCVSCDANAGNLTQPDVTKCQGSDDLALDLPPVYTGSNTMPDAAEYTYTYVVSGPGGVILGYEDGPNLTSYPAGDYNLCGLSYLTANQGDLPAPGSSTSTALQTDLNSSTPPFCGKMTTNCVNVRILPAPADTEETFTICEPECYDFNGIQCCQSGTYELELLQNGCPYTARLNLTVTPLVHEMVQEEICPDECSSTPGFEDKCFEGVFEDYVTVPNQCPKLVTLDLRQVSLLAIIQTPGPFMCSSPTMILNGTSSTIGPGITVLWTASNGGTIIGPNNTANITIGSAGNYVLKICKNLTGTNTPCCVTASVTVVAQNVLPSPPVAIAGNMNVCQGEIVTFTATPVAGATSYTWTLPAGVTVVSGQTSNIITVNWNSTSGGMVCATATNACGTSTQRCINITVTQLPVLGNISGTNTVCQGEVATYSVPTATGATSYLWSVAAPATIVSGQGSNQISINWGASTTGNVCVSAVSSCGNTPQVCFPVTVKNIPIANAGSNGSVCGLIYNLSATSSVTGSTGVWSQLAGPGAAVFANATMASTNVNVSSSGSYTFRWIESNGNCSDEATVMVNFNSSPMAGLVTPLCGGTNVSYTVSFPITGGTSPYTISGGTVSGGVFTSNPIVSGMPYSFTATDANGCTSSSISGTHNCSCVTSAGTMSLSPLSACMGTTVQSTHNNNAVLDANDIGNYILHEFATQSPIGTVYAQNTTGIFGFQAGMTYGTTYYISYTAGNNIGGNPSPLDPCYSVAQGQSVVFYQNPTANAGTGSSTCLSMLTLNASAGVGFGTWSVVSSPPGGTLNFSNNQSANSSVMASLPGTYTVKWSLDNSGCKDDDSIVLQFNTSPIAGVISETCDATNVNYTVQFPISSGNAPYTVSGGTVTGNTFTANPITANSPYSFTITDSNGCTSTLSGTKNCLCSTDAGTMPLTTLEACEGMTITSIHNNDSNLDGNDVFEYILHNGSGSSIGLPIIARNKTGIFGFQTGMVYGTTYYVSYVVGNPSGANVDLTDNCLSVAQGQPVVFYQNPIANAGADAASCQSSLTLNATGMGAGMWSTVSSPTGGSLSFANAQNAGTSVTSTKTGTYTIRWTLDDHGCTGTDDVVLNFNDSPSAGSIMETCDASNQNYTVQFPIIGGTSPYTVNGGTVTGSTYTSTPLVANTPYSLTITDANGCTSTISGTKNCLCSTDAGSMSLTPLDACEGMNITLQHNNDANLDGNDIFEYIIHNGSGSTIGLPIIARNKTGIFGFQTGMVYGTTYYVSYIVGNPVGTNVDLTDNCLSVAQGQPIVFYQNPSSNAGTDNATCQTSLALNASGTGSGMWSIVNSPAGGTLTFTNAQNASTSANITQSGTYTVRWTLDNNGCTDTDDLVLNFNEGPSAGQIGETCDANNQNYTVQFPITGGTAPYSVNGTPISGSTYISAPISSSTSYNFTISDVNGCISNVITGVKNCLCSTFAGTMALNTISLCQGQTVIALHNNDANLDGNDIFEYILHNGSGSSLGLPIISRNKTGVFSFQSGMTYGTTYYVSYVVGNPMGTNVDLTDNCLSVAQGQPIVFVTNPMPNAGVDNSICGQTFSLTGSSGSGVWTKISGVGTADFSNANSPTSAVTVDQFGVYTFQWEITTPEGCSGSDQVNINFNSSPTSGLLTKICDNTNSNYTVSFPISGGTAPYLVSGQNVIDSIFTSPLISNSTSFSFTIQDANGCESPVITGTNNCNCSTDAGQMSSAPIAVCGDNMTISADHSGENLDANDIGNYILYEGTASQISSVITTNGTGTFQYIAGSMNFGQTYYIAFAVGDNLNGVPDINDDCYSITQGQSVVWQEPKSANVTQTATVCNATSSGSIFDFSQLIVSGDNTGTWTGPTGIGNGTLPILDFDGETPGVYDFTYSLNTALAPCTNAMYSVTITVNNCLCPPVALATPADICNNEQSIDLTFSQQTTSSGTWSVTQQAPGPLPAALQGSILQVKDVNPGIYTLTFTLDILPPPGCPLSNSIDLKISESVNAGEGASISFCEGEDQLIQLEDYLVGSDSGGVWEEISTFPSVPGAFSASNFTFKTLTENVGTYRFRYRITANAPCESSEAIVSVTLNPKPKAEAGVDRVIDCTVSEFTLGVPLSANPNISASWKNFGTPIIGATSPTLTVNEAGEYTLLLLDLANGCLDSDFVKVSSVAAVPVMREILINNIKCNGENNGLISIGDVLGGSEPYNYIINGTSMGNLSSFSGLSSGSYHIELEDANGCLATPIDITIDEPEQILVDLGSDLTVALGDSIKMQALFSVDFSGIDTIIWSKLVKPEFAGKDFQWITPIYSGVFRVTVVDTNGCKDQDEIVLIVDKTRNVYIPNIINVHGDGNNNLLTVFGGNDVVEVSRLEVYDRWGARLFGDYHFQPNDPQHSWNGTFRGKLLNPAVYIYYAEILFKDGEVKVYSGDVTIK